LFRQSRLLEAAEQATEATGLVLDHAQHHLHQHSLHVLATTLASVRSARSTGQIAQHLPRQLIE
jgi:hypothetical protein